MEYVFGTDAAGREILKVKGDLHTNLTGFWQTERNYTDQKIVDSFRVVRKIDSTEDAESNCYDWYEIDRHYRYTDKSEQLSAADDVQALAVAELAEEMDAQNTANQLALAELAELIGG